MRCFGVLLLSIFLGSVLPTLAAEKECPSWTDPTNPKLQNTYKYRSFSKEPPVGMGPRLDAKSYHWQRGVWFQMPYGYKNPWSPFDPHTSANNLDSYKRSLHNSRARGFDRSTGKYNPDLVEGSIFSPWFSFWMPSLRYVERDLGEPIGGRPCEAGRSPPTEANYVVRFKIDWPFLEGSRASKPARRFRNSEKRILETGRATSQDSRWQEHSLNGAITGYKSYIIYSNVDDLSVKLRCSPYRGEKKPINPLCNGWVWNKKLNLLLYILFPSDRGQDGTKELWRTPVEAAIKLTKNWKQ